jgi:hypothetical protein
MEWSVGFEEGGSRALITGTGAIDAEGITGYLDALLADPSWKSGMHVLVDFRGLSTDHLTVAQVQQIVDLHAPYMERIGSSPVAVVVSRPVDFGMVRMWEAMAARMFPRHEVFYTTDDARAWLSSQSAGR